MLVAGRDFNINTTVVVTFSEAVSAATATNAGNYKINNGVTVSSAVLDNASTVVLTTSAITFGPAYTLTVTNVEDPGIYKCPADRSVAVLGGVTYERVRSVSMNCRINGSDYFIAPVSQFNNPRKMTEIVTPSPSHTFVFVDEREDSIDDGYFGVDMANAIGSATWVNYPASYHNRAGGFSFADGHAAIKKWLDPRTTPPLVKGQYMATYVSSPNNRDLEWIRERCTSRRAQPLAR